MQRLMDQSVSKLPLTDRLYNLIANSYGQDKITCFQVSSYEKQSIDIFKQWNQK